jgi:hypothetical protein
MSCEGMKTVARCRATITLYANRAGMLAASTFSGAA